MGGAEGARLPDFLIVGAQKSGTSSLASMLREHPGIFVPPQKEVHYFDRHPERSLAWYQQQFEAAPSGTITGEATPEYMYDPAAAERMSAALPEARLVAILRNPIDRAYSHYWHNRMADHEPLSFADALAAEPDRLQGGLRNLWRYSYVDRGRYLRQLRRLCEHYERTAVHVILLSDLLDSTEAVVEELLTFLGVATELMPTTEVPREGRYRTVRSGSLKALATQLKRMGPAGRRAARLVYRLDHRDDSYPPMTADERAGLRETFLQENLALASWLGRDLDEWNDAQRMPRRGPEAESA